MKTLFLVVDGHRSAAVRAVVNHAVIVVDRPILAAGADRDRLTPDGERLLAQIKDAAKVVLVLDGGNPDDRLATALLVAVQQAGMDIGRFWLARPVAWRADLLAAELAAARPLAEQVGPLVVRRRFARHFRLHLQRLLGTTHGPQGLALTPETLLLIFLLVGRQVEVGMFARPAGKTLLADLAGGGEARLVEGMDDEAKLERLAEALSGRPARVASVTEEECLLPPPAPYSFTELLADAWRAMGVGPGQAAAACRRLLCFLDHAGQARTLVSSPWAMEEQIASLADALAKAAGKTPPAVQAGSILPLEPEKAPESLAADLDSESVSLYRLVHERFLAACSVTRKGVRLEGELECDGHRFLFTRQVFLPAKSADRRLAAGDTVTLERCRLVEAEPPVVVPHDYAGLADEIRDFGMAFDMGLAMLLQEMLDRRYLALTKEGALLPDENSHKVARIMDRAFPAMRGINLSAYLEQTVAEVLTGRKELAFALHQFDATLQRQGKVLVAPKVGDLLQRRRRSASVIKGEELAPSAGQPSPGEERPTAAPAAPESENAPEPEKKIAQEGTEEGEAGVLLAPGEEAASEQEKDTALAPADGQEGLRGALPEEEDEAGRVTADALPEEKKTEKGPAPEATDEPSASVFALPESEEAADEPADIEGPVAEADAAADKAASEGEPQAASLPESGPEDQPPLETVAADEKPTAAVQTRPCPVCRRPMVLARDRFGEFWKCTGFPACRHQEAAGEAAEEHTSCPLCAGGEVLVKATPSGKSLYVCSRPECRFMAWGRPHPEPCPVCGSPYLVEKQRPGGGMELRCPRAGCRYRRGLETPGEGTAAGVQTTKAATEPPADEAAAAPVKKKKRRIRVVRRKKKK